VRTLWNRLKAWHKTSMAEKGDDKRKKAWKWLEKAELKEMDFEEDERLKKEAKEKLITDRREERKRKREEKARALVQAKLDAGYYSEISSEKDEDDDGLDEVQEWTSDEDDEAEEKERRRRKKRSRRRKKKMKLLLLQNVLFLCVAFSVLHCQLLSKVLVK
jgi:hypothetical protein